MVDRVIRLVERMVRRRNMVGRFTDGNLHFKQHRDYRRQQRFRRRLSGWKALGLVEPYDMITGGKKLLLSRSGVAGETV